MGHVRLIHIVLTLLVAAWPPVVWAQGGSSLLRVQSNLTERAISRNLDHAFRPKLVIARGATGPVTALALSRDEHRLVTAVGNNTVRVWDLWAGREMARLTGHKSKISHIAIAPDGSKAVTVGEDRDIKVWSLNRLGEVVDIPHPATAISGITFLAAGTRLAMAKASGHVSVWSITERRMVLELTGHRDGLTQVTATQDETRIVSAGADGRIIVWDAATGDRLAEMSSGGATTALAVSGDGTLIAAGMRDGDILVFRADGTKLATLPGQSAIASIALARHGDWLLAGDSSGSVRSYAPLKDTNSRLLGRHDSAVTFVAAAADGSLGISGSEDGSTRLWSLASGNLLLRLFSTETGWAVVDAKGRYDGNQLALEGIEWQTENVSANIEDFAETHYQAALLPRTLHGQRDIPDASSIPEGVRSPAAIRFITPTVSGQAEAGNIRVEIVAEDKGGGVSEIHLYRNGKLVPRDIGTLSREERDGRMRLIGRYDIGLGAGKTRLSAAAVNSENVESRSDAIILDNGPDRNTAGKMHLILVGINTYAQPKLDLEYARPDAQAISTFLTENGRTAFPVAEVITLFDKQATKANILAALGRLRQIPQEDIVVLYVAGHGVSVGDEWYFIPHDAMTPNRPETLASDAVSSKELRDEIAASAADRSLLLLDTCHSGTAVSPLNDYRGLKSLRLLARSVGTHVLAATDRNQSALETEALKHGIFTYVLLQGLEGRASRDTASGVSASDLIHYVEREVPILAEKISDEPQYPTGYSRGTDFRVISPGIR